MRAFSLTVVSALHNRYTHVDTCTNMGPPLSEELGLKDPWHSLTPPLPQSRAVFCFEEQSDAVASGPAICAPFYELPPKPCDSVHAGTKRSEEETGPAAATEKGGRSRYYCAGG